MSENSGLSVASLVLGILAVLFCWGTIFNIPFVVLSVVFGALRRDELLGMIGLSLGIIGGILSIVVLSFSIILA